MSELLGRYELYRIVLDYEALQDGFLDRIDDLNTTLSAIDGAGGFADGNAQKLLTKVGGSPKPDNRNTVTRYAPRQRRFGWESLGKMLKGTGLALVLVVDDERFAPLKEELMQRRRPRQQAIARSTKPTWLFTKQKAREMGKKRWSLLTPARRKRLAQKAGKASARARRRKANQLGALLASSPLPSCEHANSPANG